MDTGLGDFARISPEVAEKFEKAVIGQTGLANTGIFHTGEVLVIKDSKFRVLSIGRTKMKLKLLRK